MVCRIFHVATLSILTFGFGALATSDKAKECDVLPQPANVVALPPYAQNGNCPESAQTQEKVQYEPVTDDTSIFQEQVSQEEVNKGAKYPKAPELYVDPEPGFVSTRKPLTEADEADAESLDNAP